MDTQRWNELAHRYNLFTQERDSINTKLDAMPNRNRKATPDEVRVIDGLVARYQACEQAITEIDAEMYAMMRENRREAA